MPKILFHRDGGDGGGGGGGGGSNGGGGGSGSGAGRQWMLYQIQGSLRYEPTLLVCTAIHDRGPRLHSFFMACMLTCAQF